MPKLNVEVAADTSSLVKAFARARSQAHGFERDLGKAGRGAIVGSGAMRGLGRSVAFASASFLGGAGLGFALKSSVHAATEAQVAQAQLRTQLRASGISYKGHREQISKTIEKQGELSGFLNTDLTKSFTGFVRRTGNVNQALKLNAVSTDIARAKGKDLTSVQQQLVRALAGNARAATSLGLPVVKVTKNMDALRESGKKATSQQTDAAKAADKLATGQAVIALAQKRYGGQAATFGKTAAGAQERFRRALHETEITIGTALLPSLTRLFQRLSGYLNKLNSTGQLQRAAAQTAHVLGTAFHFVEAIISAVAPPIRALNSALGGARNSMIALVAAAVAFKVAGPGAAILGATANFLNFSKAARTAKLASKIPAADIRTAPALGKLAKLKLAFRKLATAPYLITFTLVAVGAAVVAKKIKDLQKLRDNAENRQIGKGKLQQTLAPKLADQIKALSAKGVSKKEIISRLRGQLGGSPIGDDLIAEAFRLTDKKGTAPRRQIDKKLKELDAALVDGDKKIKAKVAAVVKRPSVLTAAQRTALTEKRNQLFDQIVDVRLGTVQTLPLKAQLGALTKIASQLTARIAITKDITRKLNLEQKLFDVSGQRKDIQKQLAQRIIDKRTARQFRELGLTAAGEQITPGVANLKKRLGSVSKAVQGGFLDTNKTKGVLARIRKVLSEGLVPKEVRAKLKDMLDGLNDELKNHGTKNATTFRHVSSATVLAGLGLSPQQFRRAQQRIAQLGAGGTLPGQSSAAFAGAGALTIHNHTHISLDGKKVAKSTTSHQRKANKRRTPSRRGPFAGHQ